ncbi:S-layer homology domain-containing protein [Paenibacillus sp. KN14-4R]|uniref:S-layer homology domain-containing protein n=1 Tax=Paenibacillus sp. KN14-4R TaxID=3445773 RepID=UPI003F9EED73
MKKWLLSVAVLAMVTTAVPTGALAAENKDEQLKVDPRLQYFAEDMMNHWATNTMIDLVQADVLKGYEENGVRLIKPEGNVTRAEFVAILLRAADVKIEASETRFEDSTKEDWFHDTVATASKLGIVAGKSETKFAPNESITRAEVSAIMNRFFEKTISFDGQAVAFKDIQDHWAKADIEQISKAGVVVGYGDEFRPENNATRAEAASMIERALHKEQKSLPDTEIFIKKMNDSNDVTKKLIESKDLEAGYKYYAEETMGYEAASGEVGLEVFKKLFEQDIKAEATFLGDLKTEVAYVSDRYAAIKVSGLEVEWKIGNEDKSLTQKFKIEDTFKFRKVNGVWKLYGDKDLYQKLADQLFSEEGPDSGIEAE